MSAKIDPVKTYLVVNQSTRTVEVTVHKDDYDAAVATIQAQNNMLDESRVFRVNLGAELGAVMRERDDLKRRLAEKCDYDAVAKERDDAFGASRGMFNAITGGNYLITGGNYLGFGTEAAVKAARDLKSERDRLAAECEGLEAENSRFVKERDAAVAQTTNRDCQIIALKATVGRVRRLLDGMHASNSQWRFDLGRALAEPVEATFPRCRECGKWKQP